MQEPLSTVPPTSGPPDTPWYAPLTYNPVRTVLCVALPLGLGLAFSFLIPAQYLASGKIILPNSSSRASTLGSLAGSLGLSPEGSSLPMFAAILGSERMLDRLSRHAHIPRKKLRRSFGVHDDVKSNTIEITATSEDRAKALYIVKDSLAGLGDITAKVNLPARDDQTKRYAATLANRQQSLARSEDALKGFIRTARTLPGGGVDLASAGAATPSTDPGAGSGDLATVQSGLGYKQQLSSLEIQLEKLDSSIAAIRATSDAQRSRPPLDLPPVKLWAEQITAAQGKLAQLRPRYQPGSPEIVEAEKALKNLLEQQRSAVDTYLANAQANLTGPSQPLAVQRAGIVTQIAALKKYVDAAPDETIEYLRLLGDVSSNQAIVNQVRLLYEKARLDQGNDPNTWAVLDAPEIDEDFDSRKVVRNLTLGISAGLVLAYALGSRRAARKRT